MILWQKCILRTNSGIHTICHHNLFGVSLQLCHVPFYMNSTHSTLRLHILFLDPSWLVRCMVLTPDSELGQKPCVRFAKNIEHLLIGN